LVRLSKDVRAEPTAHGAVISRQVSADTIEIIANMTWKPHAGTSGQGSVSRSGNQMTV